MDEREKNLQIDAVVRRVVELPPKTGLLSGQPPFDLSKPNQHDSKREFIAEEKLVDDLLAKLRDLAEVIKRSFPGDGSPDVSALSATGYVDARAKLFGNKIVAAHPHDILRITATRVGLNFSLFVLLDEYRTHLLARKKQLEEQKATYWNVKNRAPNYYARTIALRFAQLVASKTGKKPTLRTSRDGAHPSTEFGRALEEIFEILKFRARFGTLQNGRLVS